MQPSQSSLATLWQTASLGWDQLFPVTPEGNQCFPKCPTTDYSSIKKEFLVHEEDFCWRPKAELKEIQYWTDMEQHDNPVVSVSTWWISNNELVELFYD